MSDLPRLKPAIDHPMPDAELGQPRQPKIKSGVRTSSACLSCRKRRTKCTGTGPPCDSCARHATDCVYNAQSDQRRKDVVKRTREDMQYYRQILNDMLQAFRALRSDRIEYLLSVIRSTDSLEEIAVALEANMAEVRGEVQLGPHTLRNFRLATAGVHPSQGSNSRKQRTVMSIQSMSDEPLFDVPAKPWTAVTDDDHFVSHLVSLYFTWEHAACHLIDRETFLEDMKNGQLESQCCSPLLVNALLATACCFSDYPEACAVPGKPETRGDQFLDEAKRLWENQKGANSLANCGALCMMAITATAMSFFKDTKFDKDDIVRPFDVSVPGSDIANITWSPYPRQNGDRGACLDVFFHEQLNLAEIASDVNKFVSEDGIRPVDLSMWQKAERLAERLFYWHDNLPSSLDLQDAPPHFLNIRVQYHYALISLYKFFTPGQHPSLPPHITNHAKALCVHSAREIVSLAAIHGREFGFDRMYFVFAEGVTLALFVLLTDHDNEQSRQAFFEAAVAVRAASRRFLFAKGMMRMAYLTAIQTHITLAPRARRLFKDFTAKAWKSEDVNLFSSELPNIALMIRPDDADTDLIGLSALFERWEGTSSTMEDASGDTDGSMTSNPTSTSP